MRISDWSSDVCSSDLRDRGAGLAAVRAYNDWHFEDWCSPYADRFIPMAVVPLWDGQLAAAEMERMARRGVHALTFPDNPTAWGLPSIHRDRKRTRLNSSH